MTGHWCDEAPHVKLGYSSQEAARLVGVEHSTIVEAIRSGGLVMRRLGEGQGVVAHYDLEIWLLGQPDYIATSGAVEAKRSAEAQRVEANRQAKAQERREAKAARAALKAADQAELERLRELVHS